MVAGRYRGCGVVRWRLFVRLGEETLVPNEHGRNNIILIPFLSSVAKVKLIVEVVVVMLLR